MVLSDELGGAAPGHAVRTNHTCLTNRGLTRPEVVVILFVLMVLGLTLVPALGSAKRKAGKIHCTNNLMQMGLAFRIWEGDHNDSYPMNLTATNWAPAANALEVFQTMSNEISTPYILVCPSDGHGRPAASFNNSLAPSNVSYFINMRANESNPEGILAGDDNFEIGGVPIESGLWEISTNTPITWSRDRHRYSGNIAMADGSVQGCNNSMLREWLQSTNVAPMRLSIP